MTMPIRAGVLVVGTIVYLVGDDGAAAAQADYPDIASAQAQANSLSTQTGVPILDPAVYQLYVLNTDPVPTRAIAAPMRPGLVSPNHPSQRGL